MPAGTRAIWKVIWTSLTTSEPPKKKKQVWAVLLALHARFDLWPTI